MRHSRAARILVVLLTLAVSAPSLASAQAAPQRPSKHFLWKVSSGAKVLFLAGSIHALTADAYPLDDAFQRAFEASGTLVEEIDLNEATGLTAAVPMLLSKGMYQDGRTFDRALSKETATLVASKLMEVGIPIEAVRTMKPWMVMLTLTALQVAKAGLDVGFGVDKHFFDRAAAARKAVIGLETAESQIDRFDKMSEPLQEQMLLSTLSELDSSPTELKTMVAAWKRGDSASVETSVLDGFRKFPAAYTSLIVERNQSWLPQLDACLTRPMPCFVVVGAAHLVGRDGLLAQLAKKGYRVEQQ